MRRVFTAVIVLATAALVLAPAQARAEGYLSPWVAANAGSSFNNGRAGFGTQAGWMSEGIVGGELDLHCLIIFNVVHFYAAWFSR